MVSAAGTSAVAPEVRRIYQLMSPVPVSWIPFEPVTTTAPTDPEYDLEFERRVLLRTVLLPPSSVVAGGSVSAVARQGLLTAASPVGL